MPKTVQGIYRNGQVELLEEPEGIEKARVLVTFLMEEDLVGLRPLRLQDLKEKREEILRIAEKHRASNVRVFGSVVRGDAGAASDVDFLVDMEPGHSLLDRVGLSIDLGGLLGCKVDVATERSLRKRIRERVLQETVPL